MAKDFRSDRIRTGVLIGSASVGQPGVLIYSSSVANDYAGNRTDSDMLSVLVAMLVYLCLALKATWLGMSGIH